MAQSGNGERPGAGGCQQSVGVERGLPQTAEVKLRAVIIGSRQRHRQQDDYQQTEQQIGFQFIHYPRFPNRSAFS